MIFLYCALLALTALSKIVEKQLVITSGYSSPDGMVLKTLLVNGQFSGPSIYVERGDTLRLTVVNSQTMKMSIHLHGILQHKTPENDGAAYISAMPIDPFQKTTISTVIDQEPGTHMYHAHVGLADQHVFGALIVTSQNEPAEMGYDEDRDIVLSDFWHEDIKEQLDGLEMDNFQFIGAPQAFLTNGKTSNESTSLSVIQVEQGKTYRLRLVGMTSLFVVHFQIPNHKMTIVEVEGTRVEPAIVDYVEIMPGQRYSVLLTADQPVGDYYMQMQGRWRDDAPTNGFSILRYQGASAYTFSPKLGYVNKEIVNWPNFLKSLHFQALPNATRTIVLQGKQVEPLHSPTKLRWAVNNITFEHPTRISMLDHLKKGTLDVLDINSRPYRFKKNEVVDIVFQNIVAKNGVCEAHPWHMHGHSFWVLDSGAGTFDINQPTTIPEKPLFRDTVGLYPFSNAYNQEEGIDGTPCGWQRIRVLFDNPGAWLLHCHVTAHFAMGMGIAFTVE